MERFTAQQFADGLGVKQDLSPQQIQAIRQQVQAPKQVVGGFLMANFNHVDNIGRIKRPTNRIQGRDLHRSKPAKKYELRPMTTIAPQNPFIQRAPQPTVQPTQPVQTPNYAGQYAQPQQVDLNNATAHQPRTKMEQAQQEIEDAQRKIKEIQQRKKQIQQQSQPIQARPQQPQPVQSNSAMQQWRQQQRQRVQYLQQQQNQR